MKSNHYHRFSCILFVIISLITLKVSAGPVKPIEFSDVNLANAIAAILDINPQDISLDKLNELPEFLDLSHQEIQNLNGLEYADTVRYLNLAHNNLSDDISPLLNMAQLEAVSLAYNDLDFENNPCTLAVKIELKRHLVFVDDGSATQTIAPADESPATQAFTIKSSNSTYNYNGLWFSDARDWYHDRVDSFAHLVSDYNPKRPTAQNAEDFFRLRQSLRSQARELMGAQFIAQWMLPDRNQSFSEFFEFKKKRLTQTNKGEDINETAIYADIIRSSVTSNDSWDAAVSTADKMLEAMRAYGIFSPQTGYVPLPDPIEVL